MRGDGAVSDIAGTLLMVAMAVLAGGLLTVIITNSLSQPTAPAAALALAPVEPGDTTARVMLRNGEAIPLDELEVTLVRNGTTVTTIPRSAWTTSSPDVLRAGDTLSFTLSPAAAPDETIAVRVVHETSNSVLAEPSDRASVTSPVVYEAPTLSASISPSTIVADATSGALLAVRVAHPAGTLAVASVEVDLSNLTNASRSANSSLALVDSGKNGDILGGDGVYSGLVRASINTTPGTYNLTIRATDVAGRTSASSFVLLGVSSNLTGVIGNVTTAIGNATTAIGNFTNATGNFSGNCYGCVITGGSVSYEGTRLRSPTSVNVTGFRLLNWTWDRQNPARLDNDAGVVRIISSSYAWSAYFTFAAYGQTDIPAVTSMRYYDANRTTIWLPTNGYIPLVGLDLNMLDPTTNGFYCSEGCAALAKYQNADIRGSPGFVVAWLRDETNNFQTDELGIYSMDVILT